MSNKKNLVLNIVIIVLTVILFCLSGVLGAKTRPGSAGRFGSDSAETMLRQLDRGSYNNLVESRHTNEMRGIYAENNSAYAVPYAAAEYYEAALNCKGLSMAGDDSAAVYTDIMNRSREAMGDNSYIADDIDSFLSFSR